MARSAVRRAVLLAAVALVSAVEGIATQAVRAVVAAEKLPLDRESAQLNGGEQEDLTALQPYGDALATQSRLLALNEVQEYVDVGGTKPPCTQQVVESALVDEVEQAQVGQTLLPGVEVGVDDYLGRARQAVVPPSDQELIYGAAFQPPELTDGEVMESMPPPPNPNDAVPIY